jgi:hypothetical protein
MKSTILTTLRMFSVSQNDLIRNTAQSDIRSIQSYLSCQETEQQIFSDALQRHKRHYHLHSDLTRRKALNSYYPDMPVTSAAHN